MDVNSSSVISHSLINPTLFASPPAGLSIRHCDGSSHSTHNTRHLRAAFEQRRILVHPAATMRNVRRSSRCLSKQRTARVTRRVVKSFQPTNALSGSIPHSHTPLFPVIASRSPLGRFSNTRVVPAVHGSKGASIALPLMFYIRSMSSLACLHCLYQHTSLSPIPTAMRQSHSLTLGSV